MKKQLLERVAIFSKAQDRPKGLASRPPNVASARPLTKIEKNIVKGLAIALSTVVLANIAQHNSKAGVEQAEMNSAFPPAKTVGQVVEEETAVPAIAEPVKVQEFDLSSLPEYCFPDHQRLTLDTYNLCIKEGMSYVQVANIVGNAGTNYGKSGSVEVWNWGGTGVIETNPGIMSVNFVDDRLAGKTQSGLSNCEPGSCR